MRFPWDCTLWSPTLSGSCQKRGESLTTGYHELEELVKMHLVYWLLDLVFFTQWCASVLIRQPKLFWLVVHFTTCYFANLPVPTVPLVAWIMKMRMVMSLLVHGEKVPAAIQAISDQCQNVKRGVLRMLKIWETICYYVNGPGAIPWQWKALVV